MSETDGAGLGRRRRAIALALAEALLPAGRLFSGADSDSVDRLERSLAGFGRRALPGYGALLDSLEYSTLVSAGRRFSRLPLSRRQALLDGWIEAASPRRAQLLALTSPLKTAHFDHPDFFARLGCVYDHSAPAEPARWMSQVKRADELDEEEIECDAVIVGTGAGGAVVAKELAEAGLAVVMLEEGEYRTRRDFTGRPIDASQKLYRGLFESSSLGNAIIAIPLGRCVGGTTTINSGTCFRTPDSVLERWRDELGLVDFSPERMAPYFDKVERELSVAEAKMEYVGGVGRVIARGCEVLGWSHHPLRRNAPDCDGRGVCAFGCPTDAKRSNNVSYVPMALERSALLVSGIRAERVRVEDGRAVAVEGRSGQGGRRLCVRAPCVVLACGALLTPALLQRQGLLGQSRQLGRNLVIHPVVAVSALFDEPIRAFEAIAQGYCVDEFQHEGILLEGGSTPLDLGATLFNLVADELVEVMESYARVASFGAMVSERRGVGRVRLLPGGRSVVQYRLGGDELRRLHRAMVYIARIFFAAGAERVFPACQGVRELRSPPELERFAARRVRAGDLMLSAYHPLGTCRIAVDRKAGVLDPEHQAWGLPGLYVCDGSALPGSPAVNPQVTIMAMATRAAERIATRIG